MFAHTWIVAVLVTSFGVSFTRSEYIPPGPTYRCPKKNLYLYPCNCTEPGDKGISVSCQNANLASISVGLKNLADEKIPVDRLILSRCNIPGKLDGPMLHKLKVRMLKVEDTPIREIGPYFFLGVNKTLQELYIMNTKLEKYPEDAFKILGNLTVLRVDGHHIKELKPSSFSSSEMKNSLEKLHVVNGNITDLPGDLFAGLRRVKTLDFHGNNINNLKKGQFKGLREVETLDLSYNNLTEIESSHVSDMNKLIRFNVSHNAIKELKRGTFARNTIIKLLNFNGNQIKRLDANTFRGLRHMRRLYFRDNEISDVGRGTFGSVTRIGTIDLARNKLKKIDYQMFHQLNYVENIDVSENMVTEIQKVSFKDLYLVNINVSHNMISKIEPGAFENCANITHLDMSYNKISAIPAKAFDSTTYATVLQLSFNNLTSLGQVPLQNMTGIKVLNVSNNYIKTIPRNTFPKLYELHTIDISHNELKDIYNGVFQTLFSLRNLNLSHNNLEVIKSSVFGTVPTLLHLDLSNSNLKDLSRGALTRLASLRSLNLENNELEKLLQIPISLSELNLSRNKLSSIPVGTETWPTMNSLLKLDLSYNSLGDSLQKGSFAGLLTLQKLNLNGNGITQSPWESLSDLNSLQYLDMEGNNLTALEKSAFGRLPIVFELNLANNQIQNISNRAFDGLLQLLTLNLSKNYLDYIPNGAFQGLVSLRNLDLSYNSLEKLDNKTNGLLDDCLSLEKVNLSHNKISFITRKTFPSSPYIPYKLKSIDLSYNSMPVLTFDLTIGTKKVEFLNVSHNMINEIRRGVIGNLTSLKVLDLSHNQLTEFPENYLGPPENLTEFYVSHNKLRKLPLKELKSLQSKIKLVDVRDNSLGEFYDGLFPLLKNGTVFKYSGNLLECNCLLRPLNRWLRFQLDVPVDWLGVKCNSPGHLENEPLYNLTEETLACSEKHPQGRDEKYDIGTDIEFREFKSVNDKISMQWLANSKEDIGDFYVLIRGKGGSGSEATVFEKFLPYNERKATIKMKELREYTKNLQVNVKTDGNGKLVGDYELCLVAVDSHGELREWRKRQCRDVPRLNINGADLINKNLILLFVSLILGYVTSY